MTDTEKEAAIARLSDAMHKGQVKYMGGDTIPSYWEYFRALARIAIEDAAVPFYREAVIRACEQAWETPGDEWGIHGHPTKPIRTNAEIAFEIASKLELPWSAVCAEEK